MRGLAGDFSTMPLKDLVVYLGNRKATGLLKLEREGVAKQVTLRGGQVISASSNQPREFFGQFLINMGHLTEDQFAKAYATQRATNVYLGKILVMIGLVNEATIQSALNLKFRETLLEAFPWEAGEFVFEAMDAPPEMEGLEVAVELLDIHREGEFRETAWQAIRAVFPSGAVKLTVDEAKLPEKPQPGSIDERLVTLIREDMSIDEMALTLHASDFYLYQRLYALYRLEAVQVQEDALEGEALEDEPIGSVVGTESPVSEILDAARRFLEARNFREAEALARRAQELEPSPDTTEFLKSTEAALLGSLRKAFLDPPRVPTLQVPSGQIKTLQLSAPERYLLSRVDGKRDIAAIVHVSPLQELEALKFFQGFVDSGVVKVSGR